MKKKKRIILFVLLIVLAGLFAGKLWFDHSYVKIGTAYISCDTIQLVLTDQELPSRDSLLRLTALQELDARNISLTTSQYDQLRRDLPDCKILWQVPFQGSSIPYDSTELALSSLSSDDLKIIPYLEALNTVHAEYCTDYAALMTLKSQYPRLDIRYTVTVNEKTYTQNTAPAIKQLTLHDADIKELANGLPCFTQLKEVIFAGTAPENEEIYELMCQYPGISFQWELAVCGIETPNTAETLILSGIPMESTEQVESYLKYFPNLKRVEMCDTGISSDDMDALSQKYPDIRFVWTIKIGRGTLRTDATAFIPFKLGHSLYRPLHDEDCAELKYCTDLICLDMGHMDIHDFSFLEHMPKMQYLIVADTPCKDFSPIATLKELIYLEIFVTDFTQHEILLGLTNLQDLNLGTTPADDVTVLKQMTWLKNLWLPGTHLNGAQLQELYDCLPNTRIVPFAEHSTANGWRRLKNYYAMRDLLGMFYMD